MNRRLLKLVILVAAGLACGVAILFWPKKADLPLCLKFVGNGTEQGKPVVFFRLEGAESRRIQILDVEKVFGDTRDGPFAPPMGHVYPRTLVTSFWVESSPVRMLDSKQARRGFGITSSIKAPNWRLRVSVTVSRSNRFAFGSFRTRFKQWRLMISRGTPFLEAVQMAWTGIYDAQYQVIDSEPITNSARLETSFTH